MSDLPTGGVPAADELDPNLDPDLPSDDDLVVEDDGEPDVEVEDEGAEPVDPDPQPVEPRQGQRQTRGSRDFQAMRNENRELKTRVQTFEQQLQSLLAERRQPSPAEQAAALEAERQRFEMMSPWEQHQYTQRQADDRAERRAQQLQATLWNQGDEREYSALLEATPAYRRFDDQVKELQRQAPGVPRKILLATAIGMKAMENGGAARTRSTNRAAAANARQAASPPNARGDVPGGRARGGDDLERRLANQMI
jgi:hypothetical protein